MLPRYFPQQISMLVRNVRKDRIDAYLVREINALYRRKPVPCINLLKNYGSLRKVSETFKTVFEFLKTFRKFSEKIGNVQKLRKRFKTVFEQFHDF